jgi:hypothetical protein
VADLAEDSTKGSPELHGFGRGVRQSGFVHRGKRVVAQQVGLPEAFVLDSCRRELELREVPDGTVRENVPEPVVDELGHLFAEEVGVLHGGAVATPFDVGVSCCLGPGIGRGVYRDPFVPPMAEEGGCWVIEGV